MRPGGVFRPRALDCATMPRNADIAAMLVRLAPVLLAFGAGVAARRLGRLGPAHAERLLVWVVRLGMPALILGTVTPLSLTPGIARLPAAAALTILVMWGAATLAGRALELPAARRGVIVIGAMIMNLAVVYPFAFAAWGAAGVGHLAFFDFGNGLVVLTLVYGLAAWYGRGSTGPGTVAGALGRFPPFWAMALALVLNLARVPVPPGLVLGLQWGGAASVFLVLVAMGIFFRAPRRLPAALLLPLALRAGGGLALGWLWARLFGLTGLERAVVILGAAAPVGFNTLVFAAREGLDREFAAALVSLSVLAGMLLLPLVIALIS